MENISIFLAKFWGWYLIIVKDLEDQKFVILFSFLAIIIGLLNILLHNLWESDWRLIVTLIGWVSLIFGLALFILPKQTVAWIDFINVKFVQVIYMMLFLIGLFLLNMAYGILYF